MLDDIFKILWLTGFVVGCIIRGAYARRHKPDEIKEVRRSVVEMLVMSLSAFGLIFIPLVYVLSPWLGFADYPLPTWASQVAGWVGAVVFAVALWLLWRSHADLGRQWSPLLEVTAEHALVTEGVFRHIRHPMYAAHLLWAIAQVLLLHNWIAGPALLVFFIPFYLLRVPREEQMMTDQFGEEYRRYMGRTGRVVPRLWR